MKHESVGFTNNHAGVEEKPDCELIDNTESERVSKHKGDIKMIQSNVANIKQQKNELNRNN